MIRHSLCGRLPRILVEFPHKVKDNYVGIRGVCLPQLR